MHHAVARVPVVREPHAVHRASPLRRLFEPFWVIPALVTLAQLPDMVRGYEGVKMRNVERYHAEMARMRAELGI